MDMLPSDAGLGELNLGDILSDQELSAITQICPSYSLSYESPSYMSFEDYPEDIDADIPIEIIDTPLETNMAGTPDVIGTPQKGIGLKSIKRSLSLFDDVKDGDMISNLSPPEQREIQARLERDCIDAAMERWREENQALKNMGLSTATSNAHLAPRLHEWHVALEARLKHEFKLIDRSLAASKKTSDDLGRCMYGPFLQQSTPKRLAAVTILSTLSSMGMHGNDKGVAVALAVQHISRILEEDIRVQRKEKQRAIRKARARKAKLMRKDSEGALPQTEITQAVGSTMPVQQQPQEVLSTADPYAAVFDPEANDRLPIKEKDSHEYWPSTIKVKVGAVLLSAITECARITAVRESPETGDLISKSQPEVVHGSRLKKEKKVG